METSFNKEKHEYLIDGKRATGITTIIGVLAKPMLIPWAARMAVEYISEECEWVKEDVPDGNDGYFKVRESDLEEARKAHTARKDAAATHGTSSHSLVEQFILAEIKRGLAYSS